MYYTDCEVDNHEICIGSQETALALIKAVDESSWSLKFATVVKQFASLGGSYRGVVELLRSLSQLNEERAHSLCSHTAAQLVPTLLLPKVRIHLLVLLTKIYAVLTTDSHPSLCKRCSVDFLLSFRYFSGADSCIAICDPWLWQLPLKFKSFFTLSHSKEANSIFHHLPEQNLFLMIF